MASAANGINHHQYLDVAPDALPGQVPGAGYESESLIGMVLQPLTTASSSSVVVRVWLLIGIIAAAEHINQGGLHSLADRGRR